MTSKFQNVNVQEENEFKRILELFLRNYKLFVVTTTIAIALAFLINRYSKPVYKISSSILIKENTSQQNRSDVNDFLNSSLFGKNENFQNELWVIKSTPIIEQTIKNLNIEITYYQKEGFRYLDAYQNIPFQVFYLSDHPQPINVKFLITFLDTGYFQISAKSKIASFYNYKTDRITHQKKNWIFLKKCRFGELIETNDLGFIINPDTTKKVFNKNKFSYGFEFKSISSLSSIIKSLLEFKKVDKMATVIEINLKSQSLVKAINLVDELMNVYSEQNLERKNHIASITIDYIERQLNEISDSLSQTEDNLQNFRSSNQLLDITDQATGLSSQYLDLQNQQAELVSRKKYYDYVSDYLLNNDNFSNMMLPAAIGIHDQLLNNLMAELISAQAKRSNLIENNQERNPLVQKLGIQIENLKKTISENITAVGKTSSISVDEMNNRIRKIKGEISHLPATQRQLGNIERKYRLNDAIYNYMLEKRAEAKITKASNLPDDIVIEPAKMVGLYPISPNKGINYLIALFLGLAIPFGYLVLKSALNNKIQTQDDIERLTNVPILGKILHNTHRTNNVMFEFPKSNISETFRALRTNLDFYFRGDQNKVIMVTSCLEGDGKTFVALNLGMSYAQLGRKTILVDFDLRRQKIYFKEHEESQEGLSSYMINKANVVDLIVKSPHDKLDYIIAGILPPNPIELIALDKTKILINKLKEDYDIIVLDTTPLAQISDAYLLFEHSEVIIVVTRQNSTLKNVFSLIMRDLQHKNVSKGCVVLNDNKVYADQYGYGYGYDNSKKAKKNKRKKHYSKISEN